MLYAEEIKDLVIRKIIIQVNNDDPNGTRPGRSQKNVFVILTINHNFVINRFFCSFLKDKSCLSATFTNIQQNLNRSLPDQMINSILFFTLPILLPFVLVILATLVQYCL